MPETGRANTKKSFRLAPIKEFYHKRTQISLSKAVTIGYMKGLIRIYQDDLNNDT
jgi:hypothetical protein